MKKKLIDHYTLYLLKENSIYILFLALFIALLLLYAPYQLFSYFDQKNKITLLKNELDTLKHRKALILTFQPSEINGLVSILQTLVPHTEDYFSIFRTVEQLSVKTGFALTSYKINVPDSQSEVLRLSINGEGSTEALINFLQQYRTGGGRLITIDKIEFASEVPKVVLSLYFYSGKNKGKAHEDRSNIDQAVIDKLRHYYENSNRIPRQPLELESNSNINYPVNVNPFSQ